MTFESLDRFASLMRELPFKFVKSMPRSPHFYTLRKWLPDGSVFDWCVEFIKTEGHTEQFMNLPYTKVHVNGHHYWVTDSLYEDGSVLINRALANYHTDFCALAERYDTLFCDRTSLDENTTVMESIRGENQHEDVREFGGVRDQRVLDIGAGTGLLLDYFGSEIAVEDYVAVEPSKPMGKQFCIKHPLYVGCLIPTMFENFAHGKFDLVVSTFGAISYVRPEYVSRVVEMLNPGGRYFLMFYLEGYDPVSCVTTGMASHHFTGGEQRLLDGGDCRTYSNFMICEGSIP